MTYTRPHAACYLNDFFLITFFCIFFSPATFPIIIISFLNIYWVISFEIGEREKIRPYIFAFMVDSSSRAFQKRKTHKKTICFFCVWTSIYVLLSTSISLLFNYQFETMWKKMNLVIRKDWPSMYWKKNGRLENERVESIKFRFSCIHNTHSQLNG